MRKNVLLLVKAGENRYTIIDIVLAEAVRKRLSSRFILESIQV